MVTYTLNLYSNVIMSAPNILIVDTLPPEITFVSEDHGNYPGITFVQNGQVLSWSGPADPWMSIMRQWTITITGLTSASYSGNVSNTAWYSMETLFCGINHQGTAQASFDLPGPQPTAITIQKTHFPASPGNGGPVAYKIVVTNTGTETITNLKIVDTLPGALSFDSESSTPPLVWNAMFTVHSWEGPVTINPGNSATVTINATTWDCYDGFLSNTAFIVATTASGTTQWKAVDTGFTLSRPIAAVTVDQTRIPTSPCNGGTVTWRIDITSTGSATLTNVYMQDTLPAQVTFSGADYPGFMSMSTFGQLLEFNSNSLSFSPGQVMSVTVTGTVTIAYSGAVTNSTWVMASYNSCSYAEVQDNDTFTLPCGTPPPAVITAVKTHTPASPMNGGPVNYRILVTNTGAATLTSLIVSDTLPATLTYSSQTSSPVLRFNQVGSILSWTATGISIGPGKSATITVGATTQLCYNGFVSNTAFIVTGSATSTTIWKALDSGFTLAPPSTSVAILKKVTPTSPVNGGPVQYTILVTNTGAATILNVKVTDTLPAQVTFGSQTSSPALSWNGSVNLVGWEGALTLGPGKSATMTIAGTTSASYAGNISNTAWVYATSVCATAQGAAQVSFPLTGPGTTTPFISVTKTHTPASPASGGPVTYFITVTNTSAAVITDLKLVDTIPLQFTYGGEIHPAGLTYSSIGRVLSWNGSGLSIGPGQVLSVTVTGTALACTNAKVSNTAWACAWNSAGQSRAKGIDSGFSLAGGGAPTITVTTTHKPTSPGNGKPVSWLIVVRNTSTSTVTNLKVVDTVPAAVAFMSEDHPAGMAWNGLAGVAAWEGAVTLGPSRSLSFTVTGNTLPCYSGVVPNTGWAWAGNGCGAVQARGTDAGFMLSATTLITIVKAAIPPAVRQGFPARYRIVLTNSGTTTITDLAVADTLPAQVTFTSEDHPAGLAFASAGQLLSWDGAGLALGPGKTLTITVTGTTLSTYAGTVQNRSWVFATGICGTVQRTALANLNIQALTLSPAIYVTLTPAAPLAGQPLTYVFTLVNNGNTTATDITVTDTLPAAVTFTGESHPAGLAFNITGQLLAWDGALTLAPGKRLTITVTGTLANTTTGNITNIVWARLRDPLRTGQYTARHVASVRIPPGTVTIIGGPNGYIEPAKGEQAQIMVRLEVPGTITVKLFTMAGALVRTFSLASAGSITEVFFWDGTSSSGSPVPAGVYPVVVTGPGVYYRGKIIVVR